jgi:hypothetical protein
VEHDYQLLWIGALMGLATGDETLHMITEFDMRNE